MTWAQKVEKEHAKLLRKALKTIKYSVDLKFNNIYICQVCGNIVLDDGSKKVCDICGHDTIFYKSIKGEK